MKIFHKSLLISILNLNENQSLLRADILRIGIDLIDKKKKRSKTGKNTQELTNWTSNAAD